MTTDQTSPLLQIEDLSVRYRTAKHLVHAVRNVSLTVGAGETLALVGESGSGKSTTAHAINRLLPAAASVTGGTIRLQGQDLGELSDRSFRSIRGRRISLVPQDPTVSLNPVVRIGEQVGEVLKIHGLVDRRDVAAHVLQALTDAGVDRPELRAQQYPHQLSGGLRQRVLIAIAFVARPAMIVADEPTSALDVTVQRQILDHIERLAADLGTGVLLVTHDLGVAADRAQRIAVMSQGRIVETGVPAQILDNPQHPYTRTLIEAAPSLNTGHRLPVPRPDAPFEARPDALPATAALARRPGDPFGTAPQGATRGSRWELPWRRRPAATTTPRAGEDAPPAGSAPSGEVGDLDVNPPLLRAEGIVKDYPVPRSVVPTGTLRAVDEVSIAIGRGRTLALVGESGSGKSTTARLVLRLLEPTAGRILYNGDDVTAWHGRQLRDLRRRIQVVQQNPYASLDPRLDVATLISEPLAALKLGSRTQRSGHARELLDLVGLPASFAKRRPAALSGGQRQRVAIARALAVDPELVVLDEPVSALDVRVQSQILDLLQRLQQDLDVSYLFISHDLAVVRQVAHEIGVMKSARLLEAGPAEAVFRRPRTEYTKELLAAIPGTRAHL